MALDEALADSVRTNSGTPTLRLYGWSKPSVTLGAFQSSDEVSLAFCTAEDIPVIRRPTGGRAILHVREELTYSFSAPTTSGPFSGTLLESYRRLSHAFSLAFISIGLEVRTVSRKRTTPGGSPLCFQSPSYGEITVGGRKVIGSAQRRKPGGLLQQGSIPLSLNHALMGRVFGSTEEEDTMAGLREFLPSLQVSVLAQALTEAFCKTFSVTFIPGEPSEEEAASAHRLLERKYSQESWTRRR